MQPSSEFPLWRLCGGCHTSLQFLKWRRRGQAEGRPSKCGCYCCSPPCLPLFLLGFKKSGGQQPHALENCGEAPTVAATVANIESFPLHLLPSLSAFFKSGGKQGKRTSPWSSREKPFTTTLRVEISLDGRPQPQGAKQGTGSYFSGPCLVLGAFVPPLPLPQAHHWELLTCILWYFNTQAGGLPALPDRRA